MAVAEANAAALGVSVDTLMENAGQAVAEEVESRVAAGARVAIVAGPGNNGGDGLCAARLLTARGVRVDLWLVVPLEKVRPGPARRALERLPKARAPRFAVPTPEELSKAELVVDALLGSGQVGQLRSPFAESVAAIQRSGRPVLSIDLPTGLFDPAGLRPTVTVALAAVKSGMTPSTCGEIVVRDIGIPRRALLETGPGEFHYFPSAASRARRGRSGRIVIVGGGPYSGAPALAGLAALRTGAERATIFAPAPAAGRIQSFSPNLVVRSFGEEHLRPRDVLGIRKALYEAPPKAILVGMGAGREPETLQALRLLLEAIAGTAPLVVDADGLDALPSRLSLRGGYEIVATPNAGELVRVFGGIPDRSIDERLESIRAIAAVRGITLLAKGSPDLISDGRSVALNDHHSLPMTVSGVGDVLAGVVGAFIAEGVPTMGACRLASYLVGDAGIEAARRRGFGLVATDILEALPTALLRGIDQLRPPDQVAASGSTPPP